MLNIPDFLDIEDKKNYFANYPGLHPNTINMAFKKCHIYSSYTENEILEGTEEIKSFMTMEVNAISDLYNEIKSSIYKFYKDNYWEYNKLAENFAKEIE